MDAPTGTASAGGVVGVVEVVVVTRGPQGGRATVAADPDAVTVTPWVPTVRQVRVNTA
jgi:hypothetical protein